jgi:hypothetical protein
MKQTFFVNPLDPLASSDDPMSGYWLMRTKNDHAVFALAPQNSPTGAEVLQSFTLQQAAQLRVFANPLDTDGSNPHVLEVTMASGSIYEFRAATPVTPADAALVALISGPCCDDPYPV